MLPKIKLSFISRVLFLSVGIAILALASFLLWAGLNAPRNLRLPVPSPDGKYFAYFVLVEKGAPREESGYDLILSTREGRLVARFAIGAGAILWSNASHLAVVNEGRTEATLIANVEGRFLILRQVVLSQGTEPRWSRDGNKLAYLRLGPSGDEIAIYEFQQPEAYAVAGPPESHLQQPALLFWSPGSEHLFFLNVEGEEVVLDRLDVVEGRIQTLAQGTRGWRLPGAGLPRMSPDGTKIYVSPPQHSVIDVHTGETLWVLPKEAAGLWFPWSRDGRQLFYSRSDDPSRIHAHDFSTGSDQVLLSGVQPNGFFAIDGQSYFFRRFAGAAASGSRLSWREWRREFWGWQRADVLTQSSQPLGRLELLPWEQTLDGSILAREDDHTRVRFGLYDPDGQVFSEYVFPTEQEDVHRNMATQSLMLFAVALYAVLAFLVYLKRPESAPAHAYYILSLLLMVIFASRAAMDSVFSSQPPSPYPVMAWEIGGLGWGTVDSLFRLVAEGSGFVVICLWALMLPALLHFAIFFPERNRFLAARKALWAPLYGVAFLPMLGVVAARDAQEALRPIGFRLLWIAGSIVIVTGLVALVQNYRRPPDRRARDQVRWVAMAVAMLVAAGLLLLLVNGIASRFPGRGSQRFVVVFNTTLLAVVGALAPLAVGYALAARKLFAIRLLVRRGVRHSLMAAPVVVVYLLLVAGLSWASAGSLKNPSTPVLAVSVFLTGLIFWPVGQRFESFIDRTFDRAKYDFLETLESFGRELPQILDRRTLVTRMGEIVQRAMGAQRFFLFVLDRHARKLRPQPGKVSLPASVAEVEFDLTEPLCQYLVAKEGPFEVEVSPYDPKLIPIFRSAADRFGRLEAAVILGLKRRHELLGLMVVGTKASDEFYSAEDLELLTAVATQVAAAVENIDLFEEVTRDRELQKELEDASEMQAQLLPSVVPELCNCQLAGRCLPARSVCGDYYDFLKLPGQRLGLAIGDVSGRGMPASLLMANIEGLVRTQAPTADSLEDLVRRINRQLYSASRGSRYCTFFYGVYEDARRRLEFVNAGHVPPLLLSAQGTRFLESTGLPLGLFPEIAHESRYVVVEPGTLVVLYSDGITEARNVRGELYGVDRLLSVLFRAREMDVGRLAEAVLADLRDFVAGAPIEDDQTLVLLRINSAPRPGDASPQVT